MRENVEKILTSIWDLAGVLILLIYVSAIVALFSNGTDGINGAVWLVLLFVIVLSAVNAIIFRSVKKSGSIVTGVEIFINYSLIILAMVSFLLFVYDIRTDYFQEVSSKKHNKQYKQYK